MSVDQGLDGAPPLAIARDGEVLRVTLNRPQRANALNAQTVDAFLGVFEQPSFLEDVSALVISGAGANFCGGFDLAEIAAQSEGDIALRFLRVESLLQYIYHAPFTTIACAQGNVIGAGADIFAACHYRIGAPGTRFRLPGWRFGIALGTRRLRDRIGAREARELLAGDYTLSADEALEYSLVTHVEGVESWPSLVATLLHDSDKLSQPSLALLRDILVPDHRQADMNDLVASILRPRGLKSRLVEYIATVQPGRKTRQT